MENNNNTAKKSFNVSEVVRRQGFCPDNVAALVAAGVTEVIVNDMGRIVVSWDGRLVMWDAPATPAGQLAAQRAILAAGLKLSGKGVLPAAFPKLNIVKPKPEAPPAEEPAPAPAPTPAPKGPKSPRRSNKKTVEIKEVSAE